jgi:ribonuclease BN (tRNA processing enzyme)
MRVTILGASPWTQNAGGACSGYLVETPATRLLLDCGSGVVGKLLQFTRLEDVDAVLISHFHSDHCFDLVPYYHGLRYGPGSIAAGLPTLYLPPGGREQVGELVAVYNAPDPDYFADGFELATYPADGTIRVGDAVIILRSVRHYIPTYGMRIESGGRVLIYSADTGPCPALEALARDADLCICEATFVTRDEAPEAGGHLAAAEAGAIAARAGVRQLMLTHFLRGADDERRRQAAEKAFGRGVLLAEEGRTYDLT